MSAATTTSIRATLAKDSLTIRHEIKMILSEKEGKPIGRISDSKVVAEALAAYYRELKQAS